MFDRAISRAPGNMNSEALMDFTLLSSIVTVVSLVVFVGIMLWAFSRNNKERFEELARLPIDNDTGTTGN